MPSKKPRRTSDAPDDSTAWRVHVEDIKAQNRMTIEVVEAFRRTVEERFDHIESQRQQSETSLAAALRGVRVELGTKIEKVDVRLQSVETKVDNLEVKVDRIDTRLQVVETKVEKIDTRLQVVETKVEKIDARLQVVETKVDRLEVKVDRIDSRLQTVEIKVDTLVPLEGRVSALERRPA
jgi:chromosome segregation ATPase